MKAQWTWLVPAGFALVAASAPRAGAESGKAPEKAGTAAKAHHAKEKEEGEEKGENGKKVALDQVPKAVKDTLVKEAEGSPIKDVEQQTVAGKTVYETDVTIEKKHVEIRVDADGKLLSKKPEHGGKAGKAGKDKDEDDEGEENEEAGHGGK